MSDFKKEFLDNYLRFGLGAMPKSDVDALVMHLLDRYGVDGAGPLAIHSNQTVSEKLKTPVSKVKRLRYDAALKFGGRIEDQAMGRLLAALSKASLEADGERICLIIEDTLAKNWLQGQLKLNQQIFDHSFNTEIVKVSVSGLFAVLETVFDGGEIAKFKAGYDAAKAKQSQQARLKAFKTVIGKFVDGAARSAGADVVAILKSLLG